MAISNVPVLSTVECTIPLTGKNSGKCQLVDELSPPQSSDPEPVTGS